MIINKKKLLACVNFLAVNILMMFSVPAFSLPTVHTSDFINNADRTNFNGFEALTENIIYNTTEHIEDGIKVERVDGKISDIWTFLSSGDLTRAGFEGVRSWYPEPLSEYPLVTGYDRITLTSGTAFDSIGMLVGSGFSLICPSTHCDYGSFVILHYELLYKGVSVTAGTLPQQADAHYIGFSGGGFDEVRLWDRGFGAWPDQSALMLDSIEVIASEITTVPEPQNFALIILGLGIIAVRKNLH